jgi:hypothetical protein
MTEIRRTADKKGGPRAAKFVMKEPFIGSHRSTYRRLRSTLRESMVTGEFDRE